MKDNVTDNRINKMANTCDERTFIPRADGGGLVLSRVLYKPIKSIFSVLNPQNDAINYTLGNYEKIFKDYDPSKHYVDSCYSIHGAHKDCAMGYTLYDKNLPVESFPNGVYRMEVSSTTNDKYLIPAEINSNKYIKFKSGEDFNLKNDIVNFFEREEMYKEEQIVHKRSTLYYGPPGTGKTMDIKNVLNLLKDDYVCIIMPSSVELRFLESYKMGINGRKCILVIEELSSRLYQNGTAPEALLTFLDGESSWINTYVISTTNNPDLIPENIINRPGRFNNLIKVDNPTSNEITKYLKGRNVLNGLNELQQEQLIQKCNKMSIDHISQAITQSRLDNMSIIEYLDINKDRQKLIKNNFKEGGKIGFA